MLALLVLVALADVSHAPASNADRVRATHALIAKARADKLSEMRDWRLLLHDAPDSTTSEADHPAFFVTPDGKHDPEAELEADIAAFLKPIRGSSDAELDDSPYCTFPARFAFLDAHLDLVGHGAQTPHCPAYEKWRQTLAPGGVTMVFASAFLNAPASMFGHTMLRVERKDAPDATLLSNIINFAAYPTTQNPFAYTLMGLMGGFPGRFSALPYYVKVQEYSNMESRDLWEYPLDFTDAEMARMLANIWELDQTHFDYYFLSENCSYHLLSLLEVARPTLHLRDTFPVHAIPSDTLKETLRKVGTKGPPVYRPSHTRIMNTRYHLLTRDEVDIAEHLVDDTDWHPELVSGLAPERQALTLDAAADYLKYEHGFSPGQDTDAARPERKREFAILRERGKVGADSPPLDVKPLTAGPETGHESMRVGFGGGVTNRGRAFGELSWRGSLHDLLDRQNGYIPNSHIELPLLILRIRPDRVNGPDGGSTVVLDRLDLVSITSLTPHNGWVNLPSWRVAFGAERLRDLGNCDTWHCIAADLHGGIGYTLGSNVFAGEVWYGFIDMNFWAGPRLHPNFRIAPDAALGTAMQVTSFWRNTVEGKVRYDVLGDTRTGHWVPIVEVGENFALSTNVAIRIRGSLWRDSGELAANLNVYY